ncbi:MAG: AraC family transcriptional regulator [Pseudomonadota bacterium]
MSTVRQAFAREPAPTRRRAPSSTRRARTRTIVDVAAKTDWAHGPYVIDRRHVGTADVGFLRIRDNPPGQFDDPPTSDFVLTVGEVGSGPVELDLGSGPFRKTLRPGDMSLAPPDHPGRATIGYTFGMSAFSLPVALFEEAWADLGRAGPDLDLGPLHARILRDPLLSQLVCNFADEAAAGNPLGPLYADSAAHMIVANLLRLAGETWPPSNGAIPLDERALDLVTSAMWDRLGHPLPIADLARLVDMNVYAFSRAFRAATGNSPHKHLIQCRIDRVRRMLEDTDESLVDIAYDCGFASQSHMTAAFAKAVGMPPGRYRRIRRS